MRLRPHQLDNEGFSDGDYKVVIENGRVTWSPLVVVPDDFLTTVVNGVPSLVWDTDGQLVYVEDL